MPSLIWHYTIGDHFKRIAESGVIVPATANVPKRERVCVWFSTNQLWEETVIKGLKDLETGIVHDLNKEQAGEYFGGLVRIGVLPAVAPHGWKDYKKVSGIGAKLARGLYETAIERGAKPSEWRCSFEPVPRNKWEAVEVWSGGQWVTFPFEEGQ